VDTIKRSFKFYRDNEAQVMCKFGLRPTANSGSGWIEKEDGQNDFLIAQLKSTDASSISVKLKDIHTLEYNAIVAHKVPLFMVQFLQTDEVFVLVRPSDLPSVAEYMECGRCEIVESIVICESEQAPKQDAIKSSPKSRDKFWKEQEKRWKK